MVNGPNSEEPLSATLFAVDLALLAGDLQADWRRCNMAANYLAAYVAYQFAEREWAENLVSTVANEVLEAVAHLSPADASLELRCQQRPDALLIEIEHAVRPELAASYASFLSELCTRESDALYFELLTAASRPALAFNQFGLALVAHDFNAQIEARHLVPAGRHQLMLRIPNQEISAAHP